MWLLNIRFLAMVAGFLRFLSGTLWLWPAKVRSRVSSAIISLSADVGGTPPMSDSARPLVTAATPPPPEYHG